MTNALLASQPTTRTRDQWLADFITLGRPLFSNVGKPLPANIRAAICPPHRTKMGSIGLCWSDAVSEDNGREIWITAAETDPVRVAGILVHELCHAALPHSERHGKNFGRLARALGLEGPLRATTEGEAFKKLWAGVLERLGPLPAAKFTAGMAADFRVQKTPKMTNVACPECGFVAKVKIDQMSWGRLTCPVHPEEKLLTPKERVVTERMLEE